MATRGFNIAQLEPPTFSRPVQLPGLNLLDPSEFAPKLIVPEWDTSGLRRLGEAIGDIVYENSDEGKAAKEQQRLLNEARVAEAQEKVADLKDPTRVLNREVERQKALNQANIDFFAQQQGILGKREQEKLESEQDFKKRAQAAKNAEEFKTFLGNTYGPSGMQALESMQAGGVNLSTPQGRALALERVQLENPFGQTSEAASSSGASSILSRTFANEEDAFKALKDAGYEGKIEPANTFTGLNGKKVTSPFATGVRIKVDSLKPSKNEDIEDFSPMTLAQQGGEIPVVPLDAPDVAKGYSQKGKEQLFKSLQTEAGRQLTKMQSDVDAASSRINLLKEFQEINKNTSTGGLYAVPRVGEYARKAVAPLSPDLQRLQAISNQITPTMRTPGSGSTSDFDARMFQGATVGPDKSKETNDRIAQADIVRSQNLIDRQAFMQSYLDTHRHLRGADAAWRDYVQNNPVFDPNQKPSEGKFVLNPNRMGWEQYFQNKNKKKLGIKDEGDGVNPSAQTLSFGSVEEADAANLPPGTKVLINGRSGTIQ